MADVPLENAQVIWSAEDHPNLPPVKVVGIPGDDDDDRYFSSWGACNLEFQQADAAGKLRMLFAKFVMIALHNNVAPREIHKAFSVIPEYRNALDEVGLFDPKLD